MSCASTLSGLLRDRDAATLIVIISATVGSFLVGVLTATVGRMIWASRRKRTSLGLSSHIDSPFRTTHVQSYKLDPGRSVKTISQAFTGQEQFFKRFEGGDRNGGLSTRQKGDEKYRFDKPEVAYPNGELSEMEFAYHTPSPKSKKFMSSDRRTALYVANDPISLRRQVGAEIRSPQEAPSSANVPWHYPSRSLPYSEIQDQYTPITASEETVVQSPPGDFIFESKLSPRSGANLQPSPTIKRVIDAFPKPPSSKGFQTGPRPEYESGNSTHSASSSYSGKLQKLSVYTQMAAKASLEQAPNHSNTSFHAPLTPGDKGATHHNFSNTRKGEPFGSTAPLHTRYDYNGAVSFYSEQVNDRLSFQVRPSSSTSTQDPPESSCGARGKSMDDDATSSIIQNYHM